MRIFRRLKSSVVALVLAFLTASIVSPFTLDSAQGRLDSLMAQVESIQEDIQTKVQSFFDIDLGFDFDFELPLTEEQLILSDDDSNSVGAGGSVSTPYHFEIPEYNSAPYEEINGGVPFFETVTTDCFEEYPELDALGRCGATYACVGIETMPTEERESISEVKPSGWDNNPYDFVDGGYLYNRCHLIGFQLTGENANEKNLVTGTRYMNVQGMLPFENEVANYIAATGNHVMYRVTPVFEGDNLVCNGVLMEAYSVEDSGAGVQFCVYCFNVQPGVVIDYRTGENHEDLTCFLPEKAGQAS